MAKLFFLLSGENDTLPYAEISAILNAEKIDFSIIEKLDQVLRLEADISCIKQVYLRSAYTRICALELFACEAQENEIKTWTDYLEQTYDNISKVTYPTQYPNLDVIYSPPPEVGKNFPAEKSSSWWMQALKTCLYDKESWLNDRVFRFAVVGKLGGCRAQD